MKNNDINMDKLFRKKLDDYSVEPPPYVWENIQGQMAALRKRKRMGYIGWISAAAVIVMAFLAGWYFNNIKDVTDTTLVNGEIVKSESNEISDAFEEEEIDLLADSSEETESDESIPESENIIIVTSSPEKSMIAQQTTKILNTVAADEKLREQFSNEMIAAKNVVFEQVDFVNKLEKISERRSVKSLENTENIIIAGNLKTMEEKQRYETGWSMGMFIAPGYSSHQTNHNEIYAQNMTYSGTSGNTNMGGGLSLKYKTGKRLSVESGIYYAKNGQKSSSSVDLLAFNRQSESLLSSPEKSYINNTIKVENGDVLMNSTAGVIEMSNAPMGSEVSAEFDSNEALSGTFIASGEFSQVFDFIEIPLYLRYNIIESKIGLDLMGGLNAGLVIGNNAYIDNEYGLQNIGKTRDISKLNFSGSLGFGINYALGKQISVAVEPRINYYLNSINSSPAIDFRPYRVGIFTGINYEF